jgi:hypothetical protein
MICKKKKKKTLLHRETTIHTPTPSAGQETRTTCNEINIEQYQSGSKQRTPGRDPSPEE